MDTKWKNYSHSVITKIIVFIITIICFTGAIAEFVNMVSRDGITSLDIVFEDNYYRGNEYGGKLNSLTHNLTELINEYKSEAYILDGKTITEEEIKREKDVLFSQFEGSSKSYNPNLSNEENYKKFEEIYADQISQIRDKLINEDLKAYHASLGRLQEYKGIKYYISDGEHIFTNTSNQSKDYFKSFPSYIMFDPAKEMVYPEEFKENDNYYWIKSSVSELDYQNTSMYIAFTDELLRSSIEEWKKDKALVIDSLYKIGAFLLGLLLSFIYLIVVIGRKTFKDKEVHLNVVDRLYNDINIILCLGLIMMWFGFMQSIDFHSLYKIIIPITASIGTVGLILVLSLVKHLKNRTFIKHTLTYMIFNKLFKFFKDVYNSGSVAVKVVLVVIGYPIIVAVTFFMFPITIGVAAWLAFKKVKQFNAIKEGVEKIKNGEIHHTINVPGDGEFGRLASNINSIADGLNKAVENEVKSERLKTELITNVSHDIRTPLTSIITYVDLLKKEKDGSKAEGYIEIIDQKAQRLKILTNDLFEASKASSGNMPVNEEKIDIISLITQGLGELNDKVQEAELDFKISHPKDKIYVKADGKLLWRAIENLLANIFKYALRGSRVYIDIEDLEDEAVLTIKNISAYELNISADELMERFKRGDESRSSEGSGLGLSIAKSFIEIQSGNLNIEIDGDLFKAIIQMPKYKKSI